MQGQILDKLEYGIGYYGNTLMNPGLEFSAEIPLVNTSTNGVRYSDLGESLISLQGSIAAYWDPFSHVGTLNYYNLNFKQYFAKRFGIQMSGGIVLQTNFTRDNYIVNEAFEIEEVGLIRNNYGGIHLSTGFFIDNKSGSRSVLNKISLYVLSPYNAAGLPVFNYHLIYCFK